jgi:4a-hydroxytetrahydrobiopterin dehydratase
MANSLKDMHCVPCEGAVSLLDPSRVSELLRQVPEWQLCSDGRRIRRAWRVKDFATALSFFDRIGQEADAEDHHPDLHLTNYRDVVVEIATHAIGGLSENDFILAAKIDQLPLKLTK